MEKWNVVLLNLTIDKTISGVNRYMEILGKGLRAYPEIVVHEVVLLHKPGMLIHTVRKEEGCVKATIMLPVNMNPIVSGLYWMEKYAGVVADLLLPYFQGMEHLIWHTHCINLSQLAVMLKQGAGGCILTHLHCIPWKFAVEKNAPKFNDLYWKYQNSQFGVFKESPLENLTYRISDHIICVTASGKEYLTRAIQVSPDRVSVVYNGAEDVGNNCQKQRKAGEVHILFVGRISKEKGVTALLQALLRVRERGYRFRLTLVGSGNKKYMDTLQAEYACLNPDFRGRLDFDEVKELYETCSIGVVPSLHEQCSYVSIEMAMFGLPMIVADVDGLAEMFTDGVNVLKVPALFDRQEGLRLDESVFAEHFITLMNAPRLRIKLGDEVRKLYHERFGSERMVWETVQIYKKMDSLLPDRAVPRREVAHPDLTVILPFRNAGSDVFQVIGGLVRYSRYPYRLLLINDASDDSYDYSKALAEYPEVCYLVNNKRLGLGGCWDKGVALSDTEYVLLLDDRARISGDVLSPLMRYCRNMPGSIVGVQSRLWTYGKGGTYYCLEGEPAVKGGTVDFSGIRGPMALTWEFQNPLEEHPQSVEVPCVRGHAYCIKKDYYLYLHGCNGLIDGGYEDAFLSAKVWLEGGRCILFRGTDIGRMYKSTVAWRDNSIALDFEKILYSRLLAGAYGKKLERAVRLHHDQQALRTIDKYLDVLESEIEMEKQYLAGIFTRTFEDLLIINRSNGNRIYPQ